MLETLKEEKEDKKLGNINRLDTDGNLQHRTQELKEKGEVCSLGKLLLCKLYNPP